MKKLFLTSALVIAAATSAHAVEAPSLGDRIKANWDARADRNAWAEPYKAAETSPVVDETVKPAKKAKKHAAKKAEKAKLTPEEKAKIKADRKAKWDAMTPEQKAAWKAKHAARKASVTTTTTTTTTPAPAAH